MAYRNTFRKHERLNSKLLIGSLFADGGSIFLHPYNITFLETHNCGGPPVQIMISVPKRNFPSAVNRNRIKRLIRESYRKNKYIVCDHYEKKTNTQLIISIVYLAKTIEPYSEVERKLILILQRLINKNERRNR